MISETNLQNIPREAEIKRLFIPREGFVFLEADLSQAESRIVAWFAQEKRLIEAYERGEDVHSLVASMIFGKPVRKGMEERQIGKTIGHASNYGMGRRKLADVIFKETGIEISEKEAGNRQARYYQAFPGIKERFQRQIRLSLIRDRRVVTNPFGRKRKFYQPPGDDLFRQAYAHYAQSTVADVINHGLLNLWPKVESWKGRIVAQIHDSLLFEIPTAFVGTDRFNQAVSEIVDGMTVPFEIQERQIVIPVEVKWGTDWGQMEGLESGKQDRTDTQAVPKENIPV